jgi:hypothetical protein
MANGLTRIPRLAWMGVTTDNLPITQLTCALINAHKILIFTDRLQQILAYCLAKPTSMPILLKECACRNALHLIMPIQQVSFASYNVQLMRCNTQMTKFVNVWPVAQTTQEKFTTQTERQKNVLLLVLSYHNYFMVWIAQILVRKHVHQELMETMTQGYAWTFVFLPILNSPGWTGRTTCASSNVRLAIFQIT